MEIRQNTRTRLLFGLVFFLTAPALQGEAKAQDTFPNGQGGEVSSEVPVVNDPSGENPFGGDPFGADPFGDDPFGVETTNWDSVFAAVDDEFSEAQGGPLKPILSFGYNKAQGLHLGGGLGVGPFWESRLQIRSVYGYDFARRHATIRGDLRFGDLIKERRWIDLEFYDDVRRFGSHQPYGSDWFALIAGYDASSYLRERRGTLRGRWAPHREWSLLVDASRAEQTPLSPRAAFHLTGPDFWFEEGHASNPVRVNGVGFLFQRRPPYSEEVVLPGTYFSASGHLYGGALGGDREFSVWQTGVRRVAKVRDSDEFHLHVDWALAGGHVPIQNRIDLGGAGGLRGFEPRTFVGRQRWFGRAEYKWHHDLLRRTKIPWIKKARLRLVPFVESGAVWGEEDVHHPFDLKLSQRSDIHWDLGFGLRKIVDSSGFLSYGQVNFAWPMGAESGPVRITVTLSSKGFDSPSP